MEFQGNTERNWNWQKNLKFRVDPTCQRLVLPSSPTHRRPAAAWLRTSPTTTPSPFGQGLRSRPIRSPGRNPSPLPLSSSLRAAMAATFPSSHEAPAPGRPSSSPTKGRCAKTSSTSSKCCLNHPRSQRADRSLFFLVAGR